jgi:hypothetical protein
MTPSSRLLARILLATTPLGCVPAAAPGGADSPPATAAPTAPAPTAQGTSAAPGKDGHPTTGGSTKDAVCYARSAGEACAAPEAAMPKLGLAVDGTVKHVSGAAPGTDATCCYVVTSVSKGRALTVEGGVRVATLVRRAFALSRLTRAAAFVRRK